MENTDDYDDGLTDGSAGGMGDEDIDISFLEDQPEEMEASVVAHEGGEAVSLDTPLYRIRLDYSQESFLAIYRGEPLTPGSMVVIPTRYGRDLAKVVGPVHCRRSISNVVDIERPATKGDLDKAESNSALEEDTFRVCREKIAEHGLDMKLVRVHHLLEETRILVYYTSDKRVDFRELVKDLGGVLRARVELRQIGVRDEARIVCGMGVCGRGYCCNTVSDKLKPVSIKMAKDQNLSFNSMKISGPCGRLLCCLSYEHNFYSEQVRLVPQAGARVNHENTTWIVNEANLVSGQVRMSDSEGRSLILPGNRFEKIDAKHWKVI